MTDFPDLKVKSLVNFPANVVGGVGIDVSKQSGRYTIDLDFGELAQINAIALPATTFLALWESTQDTYRRMSVSDWETLVGGGGGGATVLVSDTAPINAPDRALWWESDTGILYIHYNDGTSTQWVAIAGGSGGSLTGAVRYDTPLSLTPAQKAQARSNIDAGASDYDTLALAALAIIPSAQNAIHVAGYLSPGDGGAALYTKVSTAPSHAAKFQSADGAWWQLAETTVNPRQLGAIADGVTDDGAVLQAVNDYLSVVHGGGTFYMPGGMNCAVAFNNITLSAGVVLRGTGTITRTTVGVGPLLTSTANDVDIRDVTLAWGASSHGVDNNDEAILIRGVVGPVISDVTVKGAFYIGICVYKNEAALVTGNRVWGHVNRGIYVVSDASGISTHTTVVDNDVDGYQLGTNTRLANYGINCNSGNLSSASIGLIISNNNVRNTKNHAIGVGGFWSGVTVSANEVSNIQDGLGGGVGIVAELADGGVPGSVNIVGNNVSGYDGSGIVSTGISPLVVDDVNIADNVVEGGITPILINDSRDVKIDSNKLNGGSLACIRVEGSVSGLSSRVEIDGNRCDNSAGYGILTDNNSTNVLLRDNTGNNNASGLYNLGTGSSYIGQYVPAILASSSPVALTSTVLVNVTSIPLPAGNWHVWANARFTGGATTTVTRLVAGISVSSGILNATPSQIGVVFLNGSAPFAAADIDVPVGATQLSLASPGFAFLVAQATFGVSTCSAYGAIQARRVE